MSRVIDIQLDGTDVVSWSYATEWAPARLGTIVALVDVPDGFYADWADYEYVGAVLQLAGSPAGETNQVGSVNTDHVQTLIRNNQSGLFSKL